MKVTLPNGVTVEVQPGEAVAVDGIEIQNWSHEAEEPPFDTDPEPPKKSLKAAAERYREQHNGAEPEVDPVEVTLSPLLRRTLDELRKYPDGAHIQFLGNRLGAAPEAISQRLRKLRDYALVEDGDARGVYKAI